MNCFNVDVCVGAGGLGGGSGGGGGESDEEPSEPSPDDPVDDKGGADESGGGCPSTGLSNLTTCGSRPSPASVVSTAGGSCGLLTHLG